MQQEVRPAKGKPFFSSPDTAAVPAGRAGIDQDSIFSLLEHADEHGRVPHSSAAAAGSSGASSSRPAGQAQQPKNKQNQQRQQAAKQGQPQSRPSGAAAQTARAEDYYRAFEHVFEDPSSGAFSSCLSGPFAALCCCPKR